MSAIPAWIPPPYVIVIGMPRLNAHDMQKMAVPENNRADEMAEGANLLKR